MLLAWGHRLMLAPSTLHPVAFTWRNCQKADACARAADGTYHQDVCLCVLCLPPSRTPNPAYIPHQIHWQVEPRTGVPVCFYTAARLRTNHEVQLPQPPAEKDMGLKHIETQCCAVCDPGGHLTVLNQAWGNSPVAHAQGSSGGYSGCLHGSKAGAGIRVHSAGRLLLVS